MSLDGIGVDDFQLYLLKTMDPPAVLLAGALEKLDRTADEMHARYEAVSSSIRLRPGSVHRLKSILSDALLSEELEGVEDGTSVYSLPLWPKLTFLVSPDESGLFVKWARFAGCDDYRSESGPTVWDFLESDLINTFAQVRDIDAWGHYSTYTARDQDSDQWYFLRFAWGLLQEIARD